jgi:preprotein translocase subunit SecG
MLIFFGVLILLASVLLAIFVLVQNPKGGGLSGTFGGFSNQTMGVRQTTDFLEKGTWALIIFIAALCLASSFFISNSSGTQQPNNIMENNVTLPSTTPSGQFPVQQNSTQSQQQPAQQNSNQPVQNDQQQPAQDNNSSSPLGKPVTPQK